ncbi:MAG: putative repeat protein (TIGR01451 family), partial [Myxococcota bacterium]
ETNNIAWATTQTPGIDLAASAVCDPAGALPGVRPGDILTATIALANTGTVDAFGLKLAVDVPAQAELIDPGLGVVATQLALVPDDAGVLVAPMPRAEGPGGVPTTFVDALGETVTVDVTWHRDGDTFVLGAITDAASPGHYRRVGLRPGSRALLQLGLRARATVGDDTPVTIGVRAETDYRFDWTGSPTEELLANNPASCVTVVYRADVFAVKHVENLDRDDGQAGAGDRLRYTIEYGNSGHFAASDTVLEDTLPAGVTFIVGSIANLFSDAVVLDYDDGSFAWTYRPQGADGTPDPAVRAFRVRWKDPLRAPANEIFSQDSAASLGESTLIGAVVSVSDDTVVAVAEHLADLRECDASEVITASHPALGATSCQVSGLGPTFRVLRTPGECVATCDDLVEQWAPGTCETPEPLPDPPSGTQYCLPEEPTVDWAATAAACETTLATAYAGWSDCVAANGVDACDGQAMGDAWAACDMEAACPAISDTSCEWEDYRAHAAIKSGLINGHYDACLAVTSDPGKCAGWRPWTGWVSCLAAPKAATCPADDGHSRYWSWYAASCDSDDHAAAELWEQCVQRHGDADCQPLVSLHGCDACLAGARVTVSDHGSIAFSRHSSACQQAATGGLTRWRDCVAAHPDAVGRCNEWLPPGGCLTDVAWACDSPEPDCAKPTRVSAAANIAKTALADWFSCVATATDKPACDAVLRFDTAAACGDVACPGASGSAQEWLAVGNALFLDMAVAKPRSEILCLYEHAGLRTDSPIPITQELVESCRAPGPRFDLAACLADHPPYGTAAFEGWSQIARRINQDRFFHISTFCFALPFIAWDLCEAGLFPSPFSHGLVSASESVSTPLERDNLARRCADGDLYISTDYGWCMFTISSLHASYKNIKDYPPPSFDEAHAFCMQAGIPEEERCSVHLSDCIDPDPHVARVQLQVCEAAEIEMQANVDNCRIFSSQLVVSHFGPGGNWEADTGEFVSEERARAAMDEDCLRFAPPKHSGCLDRPICGASSDAQVVSPRIPPDDTAVVLEWDKLVVKTDDTDGPITFSLSDPTSGLVVPGFDRVTPDETGVISLTGIDPGTVPALDVTAHIGGAGLGSCFRYADVGTTYQTQLATDGGLVLLNDPAVAYKVWNHHTGSIRDVPDGDANHISMITTMNDNGVLAGFAPPFDALFLVPEGDSWRPADVENGAGGFPWKLNENGWAAGVTSGNVPGAYIPVGDRYVALTLPDRPDAVFASGWATDINDKGWIAGYQFGAQGTPYTMVWTPDDAIPPNYSAQVMPPVDDDPTYPIGWHYITDDGIAVATFAGIPVAWALDPGTGVWAGRRLAELLPPNVASFDLNQVTSTGNPYGWISVGGAMNIVRFSRGAGLDYAAELLPMENNWPPEVHTMAPDGTLVFHTNDSQPGPMYAWLPDGSVVPLGYAHGWRTGFAERPGLQNASLSGHAVGNRHNPYSGPSTQPWSWVNCTGGGGAALDSWTVVYTTDTNPHLTVDVDVDDVCQHEVVNRAQISTATAEITDVNNGTDASIAVETADLAVSVTASAGAVLINEAVTFTIVWTNLGSGVARGARLVFTPPGEQARVVPLGDLAAGASGTEVVMVTTSDETHAVGDLIAISAVAASDTIDCNTNNDIGTGTVAVGGFPNLAVTIDGPAEAGPGDVVTYRVSYLNDGTAPAASVIVSAAAPAGLVAMNVSDGGVVDASDTITWTLAQPLEPGGMGTLTFSVTVPGCDDLADELKASAEIFSAEVDFFEVKVTDNRDVTATILRGFLGTFELDVASDRATGSSGDVATWRVYVRNAGSAPIRAAVIEAAIPAGHTVVADSISAGGALVEGRVTWQLPFLAAGDHGSMAFATTLGTQVAPVGVALSATGDGACPVQAVGAGVALAAPGLRLVKTADSNAVCDGGAVTWQIVASNTSDTALEGVVVTDTTPDGFDYAPDSVFGQGADDAGAPVLVWNLGALAPGDARTVGYATTAPNRHGAVIAPAAQAAFGDSAMVSNAAAVRVDCGGGLALAKAWSGGCMQVGDAIAVTLTARNTGASSLAGVVVSDWIPQGFAVDTVANGGEWIQAERQVRFDVGALQPGSEQALSFTLTVEAATPGTLLGDTASAVSTTTPPRTSNAVAGAVLDCTDADFCTVDSCTPVLGCTNIHTLRDVADDDCDTIDQDCDGTADDDYAPVATSCGVGDCAATGITSCVVGDVLDDCTEGPPGDEVCDGDDNDCDGAVDAADDDLVLTLCEKTDGVCEGALRSADLCVEGDWQACGDGIYTAWAAAEFDATYASTDPVCDGVDNDCDGTEDDDYVPTESSCGVGLCSGNIGTVTCVEGDLADSCDPLAGAMLEACNARDDDCDGDLDLDSNGVTVCAPIETDIVCPAAEVGVLPVVFTFSDPQDAQAMAFECSEDGGEWERCDDGVWVVLAAEPGDHSLLVRRVGPDGAVDPTPAFCEWAYAPEVPEAWCAVTPQDPSQSPDATFAFGTNVTVGPEFFCVLDPADTEDREAYNACDTVEEFTALADGAHEVCVYVVDSKGVAAQESTCCGWTIDTSLPETTLTCDPTLLATDGASFALTSTSEDLASFECRWDAGPWTACAAPATTSGLGDGAHLLEARAVDASGNVDPTPASCAFVVDTTPPSTVCEVAPTDPSQSADAVFGFASNEAGVTYECVLDPATTPPADLDWADCNATVTYAQVTDGRHAVWVRAIDEAGNIDASPEECAWTVDTTFPETEITDGPLSETSPTEGAVLEYVDPTDATTSTFECQLDGMGWMRCDDYTSSYAGADLALGEHTFEVRTCLVELDRCDPTPAFHVWTVVDSPCPRDEVPPVLTCDDELVVECLAGGATVDLADLNPDATDACEPISVSTDANTTLALGSTPIVWTATDGNGNSSNCLSVVLVTDAAAPTVTCPADITLSTAPGLCTAAVVIADVSATDACDADELLNVFTDGPDNFALGETVVTARGVDGAGNIGACQLTVTVVDDEPLTLVCDESFAVDAPADSCNWNGEVSATATDNCAGELTVTEAPMAYPIGTTVVDFDAEDQAGNSAMCQTNVIVSDVTPPTV